MTTLDYIYITVLNLILGACVVVFTIYGVNYQAEPVRPVRGLACADYEHAIYFDTNESKIVEFICR